MIFRRLIATALLTTALASPALAGSIPVKSGQTLDGQQPGTTTVVDQAWTKQCADGTVIASTADCPQVTVNIGGDPTSIVASTSLNGIWKFPVGTTTGAAIRNYVVSNAYRAIEAPTGAKVDGLIIENITATNLQRAFVRLHGNHNVTIRNVTATMRAAPQTSSSNFPACITSQGEAETGGLLIDNARCSGYYLKLTNQASYGNGDDLDLDDQNKGCQPTITNSTFTDASDAGIDVKCPWVVIRNVYVGNVARGVRAWYGGEIYDLTCGDMVRRYGTGGTACVWIENTTKYPDPGVVHMGHLTVNFTKPASIIVIDGKAKVVVDSCTLNVPAGTKLHTGTLLPGSSFGPGCVVP